jgi:hypothetical protein
MASGEIERKVEEAGEEPFPAVAGVTHRLVDLGGHRSTTGDIGRQCCALQLACAAMPRSAEGKRSSVMVDPAQRVPCGVQHARNVAPNRRRPP